MRVLPFLSDVEKLKVEIPFVEMAHQHGIRRRLHNPDLLLFGLAKYCPKLRKVQTKFEFPSSEAVEAFLGGCVSLESIDIHPVCYPALLRKLPDLVHLHTVCDGNEMFEDLRCLVENGFRPKHVSMRQGMFGLRTTALDKLSLCAESLSCVEIEIASCFELAKVVDACGPFVKHLIIHDKSNCLKEQKHDSGGMKRMWSRLNKLQSFSSAYLPGCACFSSTQLETLAVSFDMVDAENQALLLIGKQLIKIPRLNVVPNQGSVP